MSAQFTTGAFQFPAWHGEGYVAGRTMTVDEAITLGGLDFTIDKRAIHIDGLGVAGRHVYTVAVFPDGREVALGPVSPKWEPQTPREVFGILDGVINDGEVEVIGACAIRDYRTTCLTVALPETFIVDPEGIADEVKLLGFASAGNDGNAGITIGLTPFAVVCANTDAAALDYAKTVKRHYRLAHRANVASKLDIVRTALTHGRDYVAEYTRAATLLARTPLDADQWEKFVETVLVPAPKAGAPEYVKSRAEGKREDLDAIYRGASALVDGNLRQSANGRATGTAYGAFAAWTEYLDHYRPTQGDDGAASRMTSVIEGAYDADKSEVFNSLLDLSTRKRLGIFTKPTDEQVRGLVGAM